MYLGISDMALLVDLLVDLFQVTTCLGVTASFLKSLPALPSVTLIPTSWTRRHLLSSPRAGQYSGSPPRRPYSSSLRSILYEGSPYMSSPIHSSLLPSFVPFSSIVTSWSSQTPSKYHFWVALTECPNIQNKLYFRRERGKNNLRFPDFHNSYMQWCK